MHDGIQFADLPVKLVQLVVVGLQFSLRFRSHDFHVFRVVDVAHKSHILVVGEERHRAAHSFHFQCVKDLQVVFLGGQNGGFVGDDSRVDGDGRVVHKLLQIDGPFVAVSQTDIDLEVVFFAASGQAERKREQE